MFDLKVWAILLCFRNPVRYFVFKGYFFSIIAWARVAPVVCFDRDAMSKVVSAFVKRPCSMSESPEDTLNHIVS